MLFWLHSGETLDTKIEGFTMRGVWQWETPPWGLAVYVQGAACTNEDCVIAGTESVGLL